MLSSTIAFMNIRHSTLNSLEGYHYNLISPLNHFLSGCFGPRMYEPSSSSPFHLQSSPPSTIILTTSMLLILSSSIYRCNLLQSLTILSHQTTNLATLGYHSRVTSNTTSILLVLWSFKYLISSFSSFKRPLNH